MARIAAQPGSICLALNESQSIESSGQRATETRNAIILGLFVKGYLGPKKLAVDSERIANIKLLLIYL